MTHLIIMADTFADHLPEFESWCCNRQYKDKDGKVWRVVPRRIQFYDLVIPHDIEAKVIADLRAFENTDLTGKLKWVRRIMRLGGMKPPDESLKPRKRTSKRLGSRLGWWVHVNIIGKINDVFHEDERGENL